MAGQHRMAAFTVIWLVMGTPLRVSSDVLLTLFKSMLRQVDLVCGGSNRLSLYSYQSGVSSSTKSSTTVISGAATSTSPSSSSSTSSAATGLPSGWKYDGCYIDNADGRIMLNQQNDNQQLTVESCVQTCSGMGYTVSGMEYSVQWAVLILLVRLA